MNKGKVNIKVVYNKNNYLDKNGQAPIVIELFFSKTKERKYIKTGFKLKPTDWDEKRNKPKKNYKWYINYERTITNIFDKILSYEYNLLQNGKKLEPEDIDKIFNEKKKPVSFIDFYYETMVNTTQLEYGTTKEHKYTFNILQKFAPTLNVNEVDYNFALLFDNYMKTKLGLAQNTIHKHHQHIRRFFTQAKRQGIVTEEPKNPYNLFVSKKEKSDRTALTLNELIAIEQCQIPELDQSLQFAKDLFLFSCYTGLRYSDVMELTNDNIFENNHNIYIRKKMNKVKRDVVLNISILFKGKALKILEKYTVNNVFCFPKITNQHINRQLKIIAIANGIKIKLTFHIARHTFGTMLAEKTQNPYLIMELMGHTDIKTSMIYIHYSQERIDLQLKSVKW